MLAGACDMGTCLIPPTDNAEERKLEKIVIWRVCAKAIVRVRSETTTFG